MAFHISYCGSPKGPSWLAFALCIFAVCMMYEILVALILGGLAWALFGAVARIPISPALIMGAVIIADSNKKTGESARRHAETREIKMKKTLLLLAIIAGSA